MKQHVLHSKNRYTAFLAFANLFFHLLYFLSFVLLFTATYSSMAQNLLPTSV